MYLSQINLVPHINPEGKILLLCLHPTIDEQTNQHITEIINEGIDWNYLLKIADKHRVMAMVYRCLNNLTNLKIPAYISKQLRNSFLSNSKRNLLITNKLFKIISLFSKENIRVIPYKGTVLAGCVYGKLSLRQVYDIDIIIDRQDLESTRKLLISQGYQLKENFDHEQSYFNPTNQVEIDVHWQFTPFYFPLKVSFDDLWQNRQILSLNNQKIETLSSEDLLFLLCIQIAKDCWERKQKIEYLAKVSDIAQVIAKTPDLNWLELFNKGENQDTQRIIYFALILAHNLFKITLPDNIIKQLEQDEIAINLAQTVCSSLFTKEDENPSPSRNSLWDWNLRIRQLNFYFNLRSNWKYKMLYILSIINVILTPFKTNQSN